MDTSTSTISGVVTARNSTGFKIDNGPEWLNVSKWAKPQPTLPEVGQNVRASVDARGFVRAVEPVEEPKLAPVPVALIERPSGLEPGPERRISRMNALTNACSILSSGGRPVEAKDVVALAVRLEAWIWRPIVAEKEEGKK